MVTLNRIYTKTGDKGTTALGTGGTGGVPAESGDADVSGIPVEGE